MKEEVREILKNQIKKRNFDEYYSIVKHIIENPQFQLRKTFMHHGKESVFHHSVRVSFRAYKMACFFGLNKKDTAIGGLLHDFYTRPWQLPPLEKGFFKSHGFIHAKDALANSFRYFPLDMTPRVIDIIVKHMFPLNIKLPKYLESWLVTIADKSVSFSVFKDIPVYFKKSKQETNDNNTNNDSH